MVTAVLVVSCSVVATIYPVPLGRYTILTAEVGHPTLGASAGASSVAVTASAVVVADGKPYEDLFPSAAVPSVPSALVDSSFAPLVVDSNLAPLDP